MDFAPFCVAVFLNRIAGSSSIELLNVTQATLRVVRILQKDLEFKIFFLEYQASFFSWICSHLPFPRYNYDQQKESYSHCFSSRLNCCFLEFLYLLYLVWLSLFLEYHSMTWKFDLKVPVFCEIEYCEFWVTVLEQDS